MNWRAFTDGSLEAMDWNNVVACGGAPLACLMLSPAEEIGQTLSTSQRKAWLSADVAWKRHTDLESGAAAHMSNQEADFRRHGQRSRGVNVCSDIDLFLYDLDEKGANAKLVRPFLPLSL